MQGGDQRDRRHRGDARAQAPRRARRASPRRGPSQRQARGTALMARLGFVGLGAMGSRLARRLLDAGHDVAGYNRTAEKARALAPAGLRATKTAREAAEGAEAVFSMVTDDRALRAVALAPDGIVAGLARG